MTFGADANKVDLLVGDEVEFTAERANQGPRARRVVVLPTGTVVRDSVSEEYYEGILVAPLVEAVGARNNKQDDRRMGGRERAQKDRDDRRRKRDGMTGELALLGLSSGESGGQHARGGRRPKSKRDQNGKIRSEGLFSKEREEEGKGEGEGEGERQAKEQPVPALLAVYTAEDLAIMEKIHFTVGSLEAARNSISRNYADLVQGDRFDSFPSFSFFQFNLVPADFGSASKPKARRGPRWPSTSKSSSTPSLAGCGELLRQ